MEQISVNDILEVIRVCWIRCMGNLWSDKRNVKPVSCRLLIYILCKYFTSIFIYINTKDFEKVLSNIKTEKSSKSWLEEYLIYFSLTTLIIAFWDITRDFKTIEEALYVEMPYCNIYYTYRKYLKLQESTW